MLDLNTLIDPSLGISLFGAEDINNKGQIISRGLSSSGESRSYLLTPNVMPPVAAVPAPPSILMLAAGLGGLLIAGNRRRSERRRRKAD
jgi:hypothetical protein